MKRVDVAYVVKWVVGFLVIAIAVLAVIIFFVFEMINMNLLLLIVAISFALAIVIIPAVMGNIMKKSAIALEKEFPSQGFIYQQKYVSNNAVFYIDIDGRLGVVWKYNPTQFFLVDVSKITDIRTNNGKQLRGTSLVSCQFKLDGRKFKIYTLRVSNGQLAMTDEKVIKAISKADRLGEVLEITKQNAAKKIGMQ